MKPHTILVALLTVCASIVALLCPLFVAYPDGTQEFKQLFGTPVICSIVAVAFLLSIWPLPYPRRLDRSSIRAIGSVVVLLIWALLTIGVRLAKDGNSGFLGIMLLGWCRLAIGVAVFWVGFVAARSNWRAGYAILQAHSLAACVISVIGIQEYLLKIRDGLAAHLSLMASISNVRVFSTSTPDFLAGYLIATIPVTAAGLWVVLRSAGDLRKFWPLFALGLITQAVTMLATGSRSAALALLIGLVVFIAGAVRTLGTAGLPRKPLRYAVAILLVISVASWPLISRLVHSQANSNAFRVWTWKGCLHMAERNPIFGTGVGTWDDFYPLYQLTGTTHLAHESYLQLADDCGLPALLALGAFLAYLWATVWRSLSDRPPGSEPTEQLPRQQEMPAAPTRGKRGARRAARPLPEPVAAIRQDHTPVRLILAGLLGALAASAVQNFTDSDWYVLFIQLVFWSLAGLALGLSQWIPTDETNWASKPFYTTLSRLSAGIAGAFVLAFFGQQVMGQWCAHIGLDALNNHDTIAAERAFDAASAVEPYNAEYRSALGYDVFFGMGNLSAAEDMLRIAIALEPKAANYVRLGDVLNYDGKQVDALAAYQQALQRDPKSDGYLMKAASVSQPAQQLAYYQQIADLENSPVGTVRAISGMSDINFPMVDAILGQTAESAGNADEARKYYQRARIGFEDFAEQGGSTNDQWQAANQRKSNRTVDTRASDDLKSCIEGLIRLSPPSAGPALLSDELKYLAKYQRILSSETAPR